MFHPPQEMRPAARRRLGTARAAAWAALVVVAVMFVALPPVDPNPLPAGATGRVVAGRLEVEGASSLSNDELMPVGAEVTAAVETTVAVRGGTVTFRAGARALATDAGIELVRGSVLVDGDAGYTVRLEGRRASGDGVWRAEATSNPRIAVYRGSVTVDGAQPPRRSVRALTQMNLRGRQGEERIGPLQYFADDPWDRRLLADALEVDRLMRQRLTVLVDAYGTDDRPIGFYRRFTVVDGRATLDRLAPRAARGRYGPPAETLVAVVVARMLDEGVDTVARLRSSGATWGLIVVGAGLGPSDLEGAFQLSQEPLLASEDVVPVRPSTPAPPSAGPPPTLPDDDLLDEIEAGPTRDDGTAPNDPLDPTDLLDPADRPGLTEDPSGSPDPGDTVSDPRTDDAEEDRADSVADDGQDGEVGPDEADPESDVGNQGGVHPDEANLDDGDDEEDGDDDQKSGGDGQEDGDDGQESGSDEEDGDGTTGGQGQPGQSGTGQPPPGQTGPEPARPHRGR